MFEMSGINSSPFGAHFFSRVYAKKYTKSITNGVKCCVGINIYGKHNGSRDQDRNPAVLQTVNNLAIIGNAGEKMVV